MLFMANFFVFDADAPDAKKPAIAAPAETDIQGVYEVESVGDGEPYRGLAVIKKANDAYIMTQIVGAGMTQSACVRVGNAMSAAWVIKGPNGETVIGSTIYTIGGRSGSPELTGRWVSLPGNGIVHREVLRFLKELPGPKE